MKHNIIYRCCEYGIDSSEPTRNVRPVWFNKKTCFSSLFNSIEKHSSLVDTFVVVHDGREGKLLEHILKFTKNVFKITVNNNEKSLLKCYDVSDSLTNKNVSFIEDDYLHSIDSVMTINEGLKNFDLVCGYDHLGRYLPQKSIDITIGKEYITFLKETGCHWRTAESTCCTWACNENIYSTMIEYAKKYKLEDQAMFRSLITDRNIRLWTPIPAIYTHVDEYISPVVDWEKINKECLS